MLRSLDRKTVSMAFFNILKNKDLCHQIDEHAHMSILMLMNSATSSPDPFIHLDQIVDAFPLSARRSAMSLLYACGSDLIYTVARQYPKTMALEESGAVKFVERLGAR